MGKQHERRCEMRQGLENAMRVFGIAGTVVIEQERATILVTEAAHLIAAAKVVEMYRAAGWNVTSHYCD
jgi:hypothetical protein